MARRLGILVLLTALALAGCAAPAAVPAEDAPPTPLDGDDAPMNLWLLEAPRPFTTKVSNGAEPIILAKRDGSALFIADWSGLYRSTNAGATWQAMPNPFLEATLGAISDGWALAEASDGTLYAADTSGPNVGVAASENNAQTWNIQSKVVEVGVIVDRPWLAARGPSEVTLITNTIRGGVLQVQREECARSLDGGATFTDRAVAGAGVPNAGNVVYDSKGNIWYSNGATLFRQKPCLASPFPIDHPDGGAQILTQVAVDAQDRVYIAQPTDDNGGMRVLGYWPGKPGFREVVVSPPQLRSNTFGSIDIQDGKLAVAWYGSESAGDPSSGSFSGAFNVFVAQLTVDDYWATSTPSIRHTRITAEPNHVGPFCMGGTNCDISGSGDRDLLDYFGIDHAADGTLHIAYGHDGATSNAEVRYARVAP